MKKSKFKPVADVYALFQSQNIVLIFTILFGIGLLTCRGMLQTLDMPKDITPHVSVASSSSTAPDSIQPDPPPASDDSSAPAYLPPKQQTETSDNDYPKEFINTYLRHLDKKPDVVLAQSDWVDYKVNTNYDKLRMRRSPQSDEEGENAFTAIPRGAIVTKVAYSQSTLGWAVLKYTDDDGKDYYGWSADRYLIDSYSSLTFDQKQFAEAHLSNAPSRNGGTVSVQWPDRIDPPESWVTYRVATVQRGSNVRLRRTPGSTEDEDIITAAYDGETVRILASKYTNGHTWGLVEYIGKNDRGDTVSFFGWVRGDFLI